MRNLRLDSTQKYNGYVAIENVAIYSLQKTDFKKSIKFNKGFNLNCIIPHLGYIRAKYVFLVFPSKRNMALFPQVKFICGCFFKGKKIFGFVFAGKIISVVVFLSKRKFFGCPKQNKFFDFVLASKIS